MIFLVKNVFYACFTLMGGLEGGKNFRVGIFFNKKLVRVGLQEINNFFFLAYVCVALERLRHKKSNKID